MLSHGDLFSGIGGFALAAEVMGWQTKYFVEIDPWCRERLKKNFPSIPIYADVRTMGWESELKVDVLTAGFPCQPVSNAGQRKAEDDPRWLWPEVARAVRALRPRYLVVENVPGLLHRGMGTVQGELSILGYHAEWFTLSAAEVGAPHLRDRIWIVCRPLRDSKNVGDRTSRRAMADANGNGRAGSRREKRCEGELRERPSLRSLAQSRRSGEAVADATRSRRKAKRKSGVGRTTDEASQSNGSRIDEPHGSSADARAKSCADAYGRRLEEYWASWYSSGDGRSRLSVDAGTMGGAAGNPEWRIARDAWSIEPGVRRVVDGLPDRVDRVKAVGNSISPQVAVAGPFSRIVQLEIERLSTGRRRAVEDGAA